MPTIQEKAKMIADQCKPCGDDFYNGIQRGVEIALTAEESEGQHYSFMDSSEYISKNKAHDEAKLVFRAMDRKIIPSSMVENFKEAFKEAIAKINARNKRCKDLKLDIWEPMKKSDWIISLPGVCSITLRRAKSDVKKEQQICYKTNEPCEHNCKGLCKESC